MTNPAERLVDLLDLERIEVDIFRGRSPEESLQRVFGGQVAGQALVAAGRTTEGDRPVHSLTPSTRAWAAAAELRGPGPDRARRPVQPVRRAGPGSADEIQSFCSTTYGVSFPLLEKTDVNGGDRHPLYAELTKLADADGEAGDVQWNFEKFVISPAGEPVARLRPVRPESTEVVAAIEAHLPG
ncbi:Thioredoxin/glutathione peroxidase BtuE [Streptomyces californicus]